MGLRLDPRPRVSNRERQSHFAQYWQISDIVPHIGDLLIGEPVFLLDPLVNIGFVLNTLVHDFDPKLSCSMMHRLGGAACNESDLDVCAFQLCNTLTVAHVESLGLVAAIIDENAPVGKHPVDVEQEEFDLFGLVPDLERDTFHRMVKRCRP